MRMKLLPQHIVANTNPSLFNLDTILPSNFLTITEFPPMLNSSQLMLLGYANLHQMEKILTNARNLLTKESQHIQNEVDDLDNLTVNCVQTMATNSGCTYSPAKITGSSAPQSICTCQFGQHIAALCKSQSKIRLGSAETTPCILANDTENRLDNYIGELIGQINRYEDFIKQLDTYILRIKRAASDIAFSRPVFLRWRHNEYPRVGDKVIHFTIEEVNGNIKTRRHEATCIRIERRGAHHTPIITCKSLINGDEFTVVRSEPVISYFDYKLMRNDPAYARIWLENYSWPTNSEKEAKILAALKAAFTKLLLT